MTGAMGLEKPILTVGSNCPFIYFRQMFSDYSGCTFKTNKPKVNDGMSDPLMAYFQLSVTV